MANLFPIFLNFICGFLMAWSEFWRSDILMHVLDYVHHGHRCCLWDTEFCDEVWKMSGDDNYLALYCHLDWLTFRNATPWDRMLVRAEVFPAIIRVHFTTVFNWISTYTFFLNPDITPPTTAAILKNYPLLYGATNILVIWIQIMSLAILTIWARGVGPRYRIDQLSDLAWKDLLLFLGGFLACSLILIF